MKTNSITKLFAITILCCLFSAQTNISLAASSEYDTARIYNAMAKARRGENINIAVLGGSITAGSLASSVEKRWANLITAWWETTFPGSTINLYNAGIGGTGSAIGVHRLYDDVLIHDPDFIVLEFSVNDSEGEEAEKMMEGLLQQILQYDSVPGVMLLILKQVDGTSAQNSHKPVAEYYGVPVVSFADLIDAQVALDGIPLSSIYGDGTLHPNDIGMQYIADFLIDELTIIYDSLPDDSELPAISTTLPAPLLTDVYSHTYMYNPYRLAPYENNGWAVISNTWISDEAGDEIHFIVDGNAISVMYTRFKDQQRGQVEVWVDDGPRTTLDGYWLETWGEGTRLSIIEEGLADGEHILHVRVTEDNSAGADGHFFKLLNVLKAGNFEGVAPIAKTGINVKTLIDSEVELNGSESYDPESDTIRSYKWSIVSQPVGSSSTIENDTMDITSITPDIEGQYKIGLIVNDDFYNSATSIKKINVKASNTAPVANAGENATVATGSFYSMDGSLSNDPDGDPILYYWEIVSEPSGLPATLNYSRTSTPQIRSNKDGEYIIGLTVSDSIADSEQDLITLTFIDGYTNVKTIINVDEKFYCYPNPVNNIMNIQFSVKSTQHVSIDVYSMIGSRITNLLNETFSKNTYNFEFNMKEILQNKGIYIIRTDSEDGVYLNKVIIN